MVKTKKQNGPSVCLSHAGVVSKRMDVMPASLGSSTVYLAFGYTVYKVRKDIGKGSLLARALNETGVCPSGDF